MYRVKKVSQKVRTFWRDEEGQDLVEYSLLVALIALVIVSAATPVREAIMTLFRNIASQLTPG